MLLKTRIKKTILIFKVISSAMLTDNDISIHTVVDKF